ncbi:MAG: DUF420 domain-containing protein [Planctomycetes bacterium]|nr:DUF420 domain-containing protein [Planctomycetota bacterium]MCH9724049.1 DUF420 domain-containing protein [Planctomycetota bacterium]MCH9778105.1 DUF420 domain-containing protein [Planctomycetota bacterium]
MEYGFLGYRSTFMLDFVVSALVLIVPLLLFSLYSVKLKRNFSLHKKLQIVLGAVLLVAVTAFEIDVQIMHGGWQNIVNQREIPLTPEQFNFARNVLYVHLVFAVSTPLFWATTLFLALKRIPNPPAPCAHSKLHQKLGWISTIDITLTSLTGLYWYYVAFVASA